MAEQWLDGYEGQSLDELLALAGEYRIDSLVVAIEAALLQKSGGLSKAESYVLAVEALEREVNNGGYGQFFLNSSNAYVDVIEEALAAIGCPRTAAITGEAIRGLGIAGEVTPVRAEEVAMADDPKVAAALATCDARYYDNDEPIADRLFAWIGENRGQIDIGGR